MKRLKSILVGTAVTLTTLVGGLALSTAALQHKQFDAPTLKLHSSKDPQIIERGRYLAHGPAHCADCHTPAGERAAIEAGRQVPMSGGFEFHLPVGTFRTPNITPDVKTGIGRYTDPELARMLRYGVRPDGTAMLPFMPFANLSDEDLTALISFLRAQQPVEHAVRTQEPNALGYVMKAFVVAPRGPTEPIRPQVTPEPTAAYGRYLAHSVANCVGCHTKTDLRTGKVDGPLFGGGSALPSHINSSETFVPPNLTPDPRWGWINGWSESAFVARLRAGRVHQGSPMPWAAFQRMTEDDLRAIYRYLQSVPRAEGGPDPKDRNAVMIVSAVLN